MSEATGAVVVTGAATGIGRAIAQQLYAGGWSVVCIDTDSSLEELADGTSFQCVIGDVRDPRILQAAASLAEDTDGGLRAWVNNAAVQFHGPLLTQPADEIQAVLDVNLGATIAGARIAIASFLSSGIAGVVVNLSSIHAVRSFQEWSVYAATKGGVETFTRAVAVEFGPQGIRCNAVAPSAVPTERFKPVWDATPELKRRLEGLSPMEKLVDIAGVASAVEYLISPAADSITGQTLRVDAGASAGTRVSL